MFVVEAFATANTATKFRRGRRCNGCEATASLSNQGASRVRSPIHDIGRCAV